PPSWRRGRSLSRRRDRFARRLWRRVASRRPPEESMPASESPNSRTWRRGALSGWRPLSAHGSARPRRTRCPRARRRRSRGRRPLRADAHRDADFGGRLGEVSVNLLPHAEATRHRGDDQGRLEALAEELYAHVDVVEVDFWEGGVDEPHIIPVVVLRGDVLLEDDVDMFRLALLRLGGLGHLTDLGRPGCRRLAGPGGHPGHGSLRYR